MLSLFLFLFLCAGEKIASGPPSEEPIFKPDTHVVDYDTIPFAGNGYKEVYFTNTGNATLLIRNVNSSCGCMVPYWPKEPIAPNQRNKIGIRYDTKRVGPLQKTLTVTTNEPEGKNTHVIRVRGVVLPLDAQTAFIYNKP